MNPATDWSGTSIGIAGAGRVGPALGRLLRESGEPVGAIASRTPEHARDAAAFIGPGVQAVAYSELPSRTARILVCVPDSALEGVAASLHVNGGIVLHTCGTRGPDALDILRARGAACGTIHPLQTIPDRETGASALRGIAYAVDGDDAAAGWAERIAFLAKGFILRIPPAARPLYHAAAVMASNYVVALLAAARDLIVAAGVEPGQALDALAPLARTSLENTLSRGPVPALTGPIERGDTSTVAAHLRAISPAPAATRRLYCGAGLRALEIARERGLPRPTASDIEGMLQTELNRI